MKTRLIFILAMANLISAMDFTIIYVALPAIGESLDFDGNHLQFVVSAYTIIYGSFLLFGGRITDLLGRRRMFIFSLGLYGFGSFIGGFSQHGWLLIVARGIQGMGGAILFPATLAILSTSFVEQSERNRAFMIWASAGGIGLSSGMILGGFLTNEFGWESTFFFLIPVVLLLMILTPFTLKESYGANQTRHYDVTGTVSVTTGMILIVYYLVQAPVYGWLTATTLFAAILGTILLILFLFIESRTKEPLMPLQFLRIRTLTGSMLIAGFFQMTFGTQYYFLTLYMQQVLSYTPIQAGVAFLAISMAGIAGARIVNRIVSAIGFARTLAGGMLLGMIGFLLFTQLSVNGTLWGMLPGMIVSGIGSGFVFPIMFRPASIGIDPTKHGVSSAMASTGQQIGGSIGLAMIYIFITLRIAEIGDPNLPLESQNPVTLTHVLRTAFLVEAVFALIGAMIALKIFKHHQVL